MSVKTVILGDPCFRCGDTVYYCASCLDAERSRQIKCSECGEPVSSPVGGDVIFRGYALCPNCLVNIPDEIANAFFRAAEEAAKAHRELAEYVREIDANP